MTLLQPQLGETRRQELRNASFWPSSLFKSQLVKEGEDFLLKKGTSKDSQGFRPYQNKPFRGPHKKRGSYRKHPYGGNSSQSSNQSFSSNRGKQNFRGSRGRFWPHNRGRGHGNPSSQWFLQSLHQSTSRRAPPFFQKRLASKQLFIQRVKHYHQWLRTAIPLKTKLGQISSDNIRVQGPSKRPSSDRLHPVSSLKEHYRKGGYVKSLGFYSRLFVVPKPHQSWRPVIDLSRLNTFLNVEKFKMETPESIRTSLIPGEWVLSIDLSDAYLLRPVAKSEIFPCIWMDGDVKVGNSRKYLRFCHRSQVFQFTSLPFGLATAPQIFTMIVKEVKLNALSRGLRLHQYLDDWLIRSQSQEEALVNTQVVVDLTQSLGWIINQEKFRTESYSGVFVRGLRVPPRFSLCKTHSREMAQTSGFDPTTQVKTCFDCKMFDVSNWVASLNEENGPRGTSSHEALSVPSQGALEIYPQSLDSLLSWTEAISAHLDWWQDPANVMKGSDLHPKDHSIQLFTDASNESWGAHLEQSSTKGLWSDQDKRLHINFLELKAVSLALRHFKDQCQDQTVLVVTDNSTVVAYINKQGGTQQKWLLSCGKSWCDAITST